MPFQFLKNLATSGFNRFAGHTDFLEAVCAGAALVAYADGSADDREVEAASKAVSANANLTAAFQSRQIEQTMDRMMQRAAGGRTGRIGLYKEIDDIANDPEKATVVLAAVLDVADSGGISPQEQSVIDNIAQRLKLDPSKLT